jgi:hypothetical protein
MSQDATEQLSTAMYKMRDDNGHFLLVNQNLVQDESRKPMPLGMYFDMLDLVVWIATDRTMTFVMYLPENNMCCPDKVFKELIETINLQARRGHGKVQP